MGINGQRNHEIDKKKVRKIEQVDKYRYLERACYQRLKE